MVERQGYYRRDGSLGSKRFLRVFSAKRGARAKKTLPAPTENPTETAFCVYAGYGGTGMEVCCFPRFSHRPLWPSLVPRGRVTLVQRNGNEELWDKAFQIAVSLVENLSMRSQAGGQISFPAPRARPTFVGSGNKIVFDPDWAGNVQQNGEKDASFSFGSTTTTTTTAKFI